MFAKHIIIFCAAVAAAQASLFSSRLVSSGASTSNRPENALDIYVFIYGIKDGLGDANSKVDEVGDIYGNKKGSFTIGDTDGGARRVNYSHGFRVTGKTNEPGTTSNATAVDFITSPYAGPISEVVNHVGSAAPMIAIAPEITALKSLKLPSENIC
ncbi:Adult-specific rigid cuticular protein 15.7 like protein [Argiope bruennichi]|uniref:Adult-specific rigid cuticular protein 15.7 like protein n=1 Tax=Argiope bruennichi TaxID=94029 RepID=A0A8T0FE07_ARGBR|nr:Adult-specific rigid cuticular protein 15.7 like protein [Argiope bruennichi]